MTSVIQVFTTIDSEEAAQKIARHLIEQRLAACVQVSGPVTSVYRWEGKVETSSEWLCTAKTLEGKYTQVENAIRKVHTYDEPEILAVPVVEGSEGYLKWVWRECG